MLLALGACSSGDSNDNDVTPPPPPPATTGVLSTGVITGFGSVYLNGERYGTNDASVTMDDQAADMSQLRVGQYVELKGHRHGAGDLDADVIRYHNVMEGPISSIDVGAESFVAMGQTVQATFDTVFGDDITPASVEGLAVGEVVEVSGVVPQDGVVDATRIDLKPDGGPYDVTGYVTGVSVVAHRFDLNGLVVDYSTANMEDFTTGDPAAGDLVLVKGFTFLADGAFLAIRVELRSEDRLVADRGDLVEVEGIVADFVSVTNFKVADWKVTTTATTEYEHGTSANLANGVHVLVKGVTDATGCWSARKIAFREVSEIRIVAQVGRHRAKWRAAVARPRRGDDRHDGLPGHVRAGAARLRPGRRGRRNLARRPGLRGAGCIGQGRRDSRRAHRPGGRRARCAARSAIRRRRASTSCRSW